MYILINAMNLDLFIFIKWIHIVSVSVWIGGIILTIFINRKLIRTYERREAFNMMRKIGSMIQFPMRIFLYIAIISGLFLLWLRTGSFYAIYYNLYNMTNFGMFLLLKFISVTLILLLLPFHSFFSSRASMTSGESFRKNRLLVVIIGWIILILSLLAVFAGIGLRIY
jgi:putative copper export protein